MNGINIFKAMVLVLSAFSSLVCAKPILTAGLWTNISPPGFGSGNLTQGMAMDPGNPNVLYLCVCAGGCGGGGVTKGIYKTTDAGSSWTNMHAFDSPNHIRIDPKNSQHLYLSDGVCGSTQGFYVSNDGGASWAHPAGFDSVGKIINDYDMYQIDVDPTDFNHFILTYHYYWYNGMTGGVVESFDGGQSCTIHPPIAGVSGNGGYNCFFLYDPVRNLGDARTWLFMTQPGGSGQGWYRTTDAGTTWTSVSTLPMIHGGAQIYYTKNGTLYAPSETAIRRSTDNGISWQTTSTGLPYAYYRTIIGDGTMLYASPSNGGTFFEASETDAATWTAYGSQTLTDQAFGMAFDATSGILYGACQTAGMWATKIPGYTTRAMVRTASAPSAVAVRLSKVILTREGTAISDARSRTFDIKGSRIGGK